MFAELQELTQPERAEMSAVAFGLTMSIIVGACIVFAYLLNSFLKMPPYDEVGSNRHPADDVHLPEDEWPLVENYKRDNPSRAYFPREKGK